MTANRTLARVDADIAEARAVLAKHNIPPAYDNDGNVVQSGGGVRESYTRRLASLEAERASLLRILNA